MNPPVPRGTVGWRRWTQFSLRTFLLLVTLCAVWLGVWVHRTRVQEDAVRRVEAMGGVVEYDWRFTPEALAGTDEDLEAHGPRWLRRLMGDQYFQTVVLVRIECPVSSSDLEVLTNFPRLKYFYMGNNMGDACVLTDEGARVLSTINSLEYVGFDDRLTTDDGFRAITKLRDLKELSLPGLAITDNGFASIANLSSLETLSFGADPLWPEDQRHRIALITDAGLAHLSGLKALRTLHLRGTRITDVGLRHLSGLTSLEVLGLGYTQLSDDGVEALVPLSSLTKLDLFGTKITDAGVEKLVAIQSLRELSLFDTAITDRSVDSLCRLQGLERLEVYSTSISASGVARLEAALPNCNVYAP